ncbi:polysaccharide deacetylase family protein [Paenisporosarcina sp.]|uniref:polysaccharide deacetylase family protein n=1 Tax=Paenisporosarcina sp. TaxID=1932001 RepID=UPI003C75B92A
MDIIYINFKKFSFVFVVIFTLMFFSSHTEAEESPTYAIKPFSNVGGFVYLNDERIGFATFMKSRTYQLVSEDETSYHVAFGNGFVNVDKKSAGLVESPQNHDLEKGSFTVIPKSRQIVLSHPKSKSAFLGYVNPGVRIPVIKEDKGYYEFNFGGTKGYILKSNTNDDNGIPVLMYHHLMWDKALSDHANNNMTIEYMQFEEQMRYLKDNKWKTISMQQLDDWLNLQNNMPEKVVAITFDDGITSTVDLAYPLLKDMNFRATSFVITGKIRQSAKYWIASDLQYVGLKEIKATADIYDYQHHSNDMHLYKSGAKSGMFTTESYEAILEDIQNGSAQLGKAFSNDIVRTKYLAYPFGHYNQITIQAAQDAGMRLAFTTVTGNVKLNDSPYELKRQGIAPYHSMEDFIKKIEGTYK